MQRTRWINRSDHIEFQKPDAVTFISPGPYPVDEVKEAVRII